MPPSPRAVVEAALKENQPEIVDWLHSELPAEGFVHPFTCLWAGIDGGFQVFRIEAAGEPAVIMATGPGSSCMFPINILVVDSRGEVGRLILGTDPRLGN